MAKKKKAVLPDGEEFIGTGITIKLTDPTEPTVQEPIVLTPAFQPPPKPRKALTSKEIDAIYEKNNVPRNFNSDHPSWKTPSIQNRFAVVKTEIALAEGN